MRISIVTVNYCTCDPFVVIDQYLSDQSRIPVGDKYCIDKNKLYMEYINSMAMPCFTACFGVNQME